MSIRIAPFASAHATDAARMFVDFEAFNPEAATFWLRHVTPGHPSLMRVPESPTAELAGRLLIGRVSHEHADPHVP